MIFKVFYNIDYDFWRTAQLRYLSFKLFRLLQSFYGYPVEDWVYTYEEQLFNVTVLNYRLMAGTKKLKRLSTGGNSYIQGGGKKVGQSVTYIILEPYK